MLAGRPPFLDGELIVKLAKHCTEEPTRLEELRPEVPPALAGVLRKMMAKRLEARYQKPAEAAQALATILGRLDASLLAADWQPPNTSTAASRKPAAAPATPQPTRTIPLWLAGVYLLMFVAAFVAFWLFLRK